MPFTTKPPNTRSKLHDISKGKIHNLTITDGVLNIPLLIMDKTTRKKINKKIEDFYI